MAGETFNQGGPNNQGRGGQANSQGGTRGSAQGNAQGNIQGNGQRNVNQGQGGTDDPIEFQSPNGRPMGQGNFYQSGNRQGGQRPNGQGAVPNQGGFSGGSQAGGRGGMMAAGGRFDAAPNRQPNQGSNPRAASMPSTPRPQFTLQEVDDYKKKEEESISSDDDPFRRAQFGQADPNSLPGTRGTIQKALEDGDLEMNTEKPRIMGGGYAAGSRQYSRAGSARIGKKGAGAQEAEPVEFNSSWKKGGTMDAASSFRHTYESKASGGGGYMTRQRADDIEREEEEEELRQQEMEMGGPRKPRKSIFNETDFPTQDVGVFYLYGPVHLDKSKKLQQGVEFLMNIAIIGGSLIAMWFVTKMFFFLLYILVFGFIF